MLDTDFISLTSVTLIGWLSLAILIAVYIYFQLHLSFNANKPLFRSAILSFANLMILVGIAILIIDPKIRDEENATDNIELFTHSEASANYFIEKLSPLENYQFITQEAVSGLTEEELDQFVRKSRNIASKIVTEPQQIFQSDHPRAIDLISIAGDGLNRREVRQIQSMDNLRVRKIKYDKPTLKPGFHSVYWKNKLHLGEALTVTTNIIGDQEPTNQDNASNFSAALIDPVGNVIDKVNFGNKTSVSFTDVPKTLGRHLYKIQLLFDKKAIASELLPVQVIESSPLKLLVLQSSPSFETKQVQNWAANYGAVIVTNSSISTNLSHTKTVNLALRDNLEHNKKYKNFRLNQNNLSDFDLVIIDERRYLGLSSQERLALMESTTDGLGIIFLVQDNRTTKQGKKQTTSHQIIPPWMKIEPLNNSVEKNIQLTNFENGQYLNATSLTPVSLTGKSIKKIVQLQGQASDYKTLAASQTGDPLVINYKFDLGRITVSLVKNTFRWVSNGNSRFHAQFWQHLIQNTGRKNVANLTWLSTEDTTLSSGDNEYHTLGSRSKLCFITDSINKTMSATVKSIDSEQREKTLMLNRSPTIKSKFCSYFWPKYAGWHQITVKQTSDKIEQIHQGNLYFYVYQTSDWKSQRQLNKLDATQRFVNQVNDSKITDHTSAVARYTNINPWILWALVVLGLIIIWIEEKWWESSDIE